MGGYTAFFLSTMLPTYLLPPDRARERLVGAEATVQVSPKKVGDEREPNTGNEAESIAVAPPALS